jgi:hypothetical protein
MRKFLIPASLIQQGMPFLKWHLDGDAVDFCSLNTLAISGRKFLQPRPVFIASTVAGCT